MSRVQGAADIDIDLQQLFAGIARGWKRILAVTLAVTGLAFAYASLSTPHFRAETRILIETRESVFTRPPNNSEADRPILDEEGVTSQVEVITSTDLLKEVADKLDLARLPELDSENSMSALDNLLVLTGLKSDPGEVAREQRVLKAIREKLTVYRVEKSRVIVIEFSSEDPRLAAAVPNALADAYIAVSRAAKLQSNTDATEWLEPEIADLSKRVKEAEARVAAFRSQSDLLAGQNESVLATQQLSELSSELSRVRAARGTAEANAESVRLALRSGASLDAMPDVLSSGLIQRLRERQVQLKADIADLSTTLLGNHPRIRALNSQLVDLDRQIRNEAENALKALVTEAQTARLREQQLVADLNMLKAASARAGDQQVELRALEREAAAQRELLESYLSRYREAASRSGDRNYLPADARIFSRAIVPSEHYFPKLLPIVGAAFVASLLIMSIVTLLTELFSGRAMRPTSGVAFEPVSQIVMDPVGQNAEPVHAEAGPAAVVTMVAPAAQVVAAMAVEPEPVHTMPAQEVTPGPAGRPHAANQSSRSRLGEIGIETAADRLIARGTTRALFVSPEGDEGAASAILVARQIADAGLRVLLLDLTASGAASRPMLDGPYYPGITNLLASEAQFSDVIHVDHYSDCHVIPVGTADAERAMRSAERLPIIMSSLTTAYDVVVVECGPADAAGIARLMGEGAEILLSVLEPSDRAVTAAAADLAAGYGAFTAVTPVGSTELSPVPGRSAA